MSKEVIFSDGSELPKLLRPKDIKEYYKIGDVKLQELLNRRDFPSFRLGRDWFIIEDKFIEWMAQQTKKLKFKI